MRKFTLKGIDWPEFGTTLRPETPSAEEFLRRIGNTRLKMEEKGLTHLAVYADREHFANMAVLLRNRTSRFKICHRHTILYSQQFLPPRQHVGA